MKDVKAESKITCCYNCCSPLVWTFEVAFKEWKCVECGKTYEMFDDWIELPETPGLKSRHDELLKVWGVQVNKVRDSWLVSEITNGEMSDLMAEFSLRSQLKEGGENEG